MCELGQSAKTFAALYACHSYVIIVPLTSLNNDALAARFILEVRRIDELANGLARVGSYDQMLDNRVSINPAPLRDPVMTICTAKIAFRHLLHERFR